MTASALPAFPVRRPRLDLSSVPRHWNGGDPFATHFMNALSSTFPDGEAFFVRSVMHFRERVTDPELRRRIQDFAGQEGQHSRLHQAHVRLLLEQGYAAIATRNRIARWVMELSVRRAPRASLASTAALEHLTALLARRVLGEPERFTGAMDPRMARLWRWHALEEAEHKAVAFDVYRQTVPGFALRAAMLVSNSVGLAIEILDRTAYMLWKDGLLFRRATWRSGWRFLFGQGRNAGFLRGLGRDYWRWYRRDFHPDQLDDAPLVERWRPRIEAEIG